MVLKIVQALSIQSHVSTVWQLFVNTIISLKNNSSVLYKTACSIYISVF